MSYGDPNAGLHAAFAVIAALYHRDATGEGQYIDMSQWESSMNVLGDAFMHQVMNGDQPARSGSRVPHMSPHGVFMCAGEDRWLSIACGNDDEWRALAAAMGRPELAGDARFRTLADRKANEDELEMLIMEWTLQHDPFEAMDILQAAGVAAYPPLMNREVLESPQLAVRDFWVEKEHPQVGVRRHAGVPYHLSDTPAAVWRAAPVMGQDNDYVYQEVLGMTLEEIADYTARGVFK
jgi:crotonobetainyl-CoA:carnitine CoA-transferase CaiB-like acyl-CoA transferase